MFKNIICSFVFIVSLSAEIHEILNINQLKSFIEEDTLILFDIDNTIMEPIQELCTDQWFCSQRKVYEEQGMILSEALEKALEEWISVLHVTKVRPVENHVSTFIVF